MFMGHVSSAQQRSLKLATLAASFLAVVFAMVAGGSAPAMAADPDSWHSNVMREMKSAEAGVQRGSVRVASLGGAYSGEDRPARTRRASATSEEDRPQSSRRAARSTSSEDQPSRSRGSLSGGGNVSWVANAGCLDGTLRGVVTNLASNYGAVRVNSTCRSAGHNRSVGGAPRSLHLSGDAVDFRVFSNISAAYASLRSNGSVGGLKHYGGGLFHIDNGARRSW
jgi:hypothetical protein